MAVNKPDTITQLADGGQEFIWNEPQWFGLWARFDGEPGEGTDEWGLEGCERGDHHDERDVLMAQFQATRWSDAKAVFRSLIEWAAEGKRECVSVTDLPVPRSAQCPGACVMAPFNRSSSCKSECHVLAAADAPHTIYRDDYPTLQAALDDARPGDTVDAGQTRILKSITVPEGVILTVGPGRQLDPGAGEL